MKRVSACLVVLAKVASAARFIELYVEPKLFGGGSLDCSQLEEFRETAQKCVQACEVQGATIGFSYSECVTGSQNPFSSEQAVLLRGNVATSIVEDDPDALDSCMRVNLASTSCLRSMQDTFPGLVQLNYMELPLATTTTVPAPTYAPTVTPTKSPVKQPSSSFSTAVEVETFAPTIAPTNATKNDAEEEKKESTSTRKAAMIGLIVTIIVLILIALVLIGCLLQSRKRDAFEDLSYGDSFEARVETVHKSEVPNWRRKLFGPRRATRAVGNKQKQQNLANPTDTTSSTEQDPEHGLAEPQGQSVLAASFKDLIRPERRLPKPSYHCREDSDSELSGEVPEKDELSSSGASSSFESRSDESSEYSGSFASNSTMTFGDERPFKSWMEKGPLIPAAAKKVDDPLNARHV